MKKNGGIRPALRGGIWFDIEHAMFFSFYVSDSCRQGEKGGGEHPACTSSFNCFLLPFFFILLPF